MTDDDFKAWLRSGSSRRVVLVEAQANTGSAEEDFWLSNRPYIREDTNIAYEACIAGGVTFREELSLTGEASAGFGDIELENADGSRDEWLTHVWANRPVSVYLGDAQWPRADFRLIFQGVVADIGDGAETLTLSLLNKLDRLNNPAIEQTLGGSGDNADELIPHVLGEVHGMSPLLTSVDQDYKVHGGAIERIIEARDMGDPTIVITESLASGSFRVSGGKVRGQITADVQGAKPGGTYTNNISTLVQHLVTAYGPSAQRFDAGDLDAAQLAAFETAYPQPVGLLMNDNTSVLAHAQSLAGSVGAQVVCTTLGKLRLIPLALPAVGTPVVVGPGDMVANTLRPAQRTEVKAACRLGYCRNWTVQQSGLATGLPATSSDLLGTEWLTVQANDSAVAAKYRLTTEPDQEDTLLLRTVDAQAECERRRDLWKEPHTVYQAEYYAHMLLTELGDAITIDHPRYGLAGGKTGLVVSIERDWLAGRVTVGVLI
ncbi:hypothetical protein [Xenophilus sp. Marseille-Q4582]|uniref:hypothetical protein n=1 Tax=Xenophilus sp. Marseille-Q4582 TaxID=2866600 RepID=UPI001CE40653|nr:hypothetical protein [Xenophilus sp. Marseille-Q4582]